MSRVSNPSFLQGYWPLSSAYEVGGEVQDISGHNRHGIPTALTYEDGPVNGKSIADFNGSSSFVRIPHDEGLALNGSATVSFWMNKKNASLLRFIIFKGTSNDSTMKFEYRINTTPGLRELASTINGQYKDSLSEAFLDSHLFLSVVFDADNANFSDNSIYQSNKGLIGNVASNSDIYIGRQRLDAFGNYFEGNVYNVRVYDCALTQNEIKEIYNLERKR
tara:strand:+ start:110231 stop:110890 length:660 start_codon:yes stop_codon:yes gene_type:complete